jgi:hypothetical protein
MDISRQFWLDRAQWPDRDANLAGKFWRLPVYVYFWQKKN